MGNKLNHRRKLAGKLSSLKLARKFRHQDDGKEKQETLKRYHKASRKASKLQLSKYIHKPAEPEPVPELEETEKEN